MRTVLQYTFIVLALIGCNHKTVNNAVPWYIDAASLSARELGYRYWLDGFLPKEGFLPKSSVVAIGKSVNMPADVSVKFREIPGTSHVMGSVTIQKYEFVVKSAQFTERIPITVVKKRRGLSWEFVSRINPESGATEIAPERDNLIAYVAYVIRKNDLKSEDLIEIPKIQETESLANVLYRYCLDKLTIIDNVKMVKYEFQENDGSYPEYGWVTTSSLR